MEENKIINPETQKKKGFNFKLPKFKGSGKIKNQALFKKGSYSVALTAIVLVGIVLLNVLVGVLSNRFMLEYDMTGDKINSIDQKNINYIKKIDEEVSIKMCAKPSEYYGGMMTQYASNLYGISDDYGDYYKQTVKLIEKYNDYNKNIKVEFLDTQDASFTEITTKYSNEKLNYGDIIVSHTKDGAERYKIIGYKDIYEINVDDTYAQYGMSYSTITGNNIETALTSAIAYATSSETKKVAFLTGHSSTDYTANYRKLLETNGYEVDVISDKLITEISREYDSVFIVSPTLDFLETELNALSVYLDNNEQYEKGLVFFADATAPYLENFYGFLEQWGIEVSKGILFETNSSNCMPNKPTVMGAYPASDDEITNNIQICITGYNIPMNPAFKEEGNIKVTSLISTPDTVVNAPVGTSNDWKDADNYEKSSFSSVLQSKRSSYDAENNVISNHIVAFNSIEYIYGDYAEYNDVGNKNIALAVAERTVGAEDTDISFVTKQITNQSFSNSITETGYNLIRIIFMGIVPIICIALGVYVYIRRKNA